MKYFHYHITGDELAEPKGEIASIPEGFIEYEVTLSGNSVYYKIENNKITEVVGEAIYEPAARRRVNEFLAAYLATPPGAW